MWVIVISLCMFLISTSFSTTVAEVLITVFLLPVSEGQSHMGEGHLEG